MTDTTHETEEQREVRHFTSEIGELKTLDWEALRDRLTRCDENPTWRSLDELSETPEFFDYLHREFPRQASEWIDPSSRRQFLKLMAASLGLAGLGLSGCMRQPDEMIVPYVKQPEDLIPGKTQYFATCSVLGGYATGLLVESHLGRPTKIEGNPDHPASLGATDALTQASILSLYDPDRSQTILRAGQIATWEEFITAAIGALSSVRQQNGRGLAILTETVTSPTLAAQLRLLRQELPEMKWHQYEPLGRDNVRAGAQLAFGEYVDTVYHFDQADVVLALDCEFLTNLPGSLRYTRDFINRRRVAGKAESQLSMNRLYAVESTPGLTGAQADHRLSIRADDVETVSRAIAHRLGIDVRDDHIDLPNTVPSKWIDCLVADLKSHSGRSIVIAGDGQPAIVHSLVHAMNRQLDNVNHTVSYIAPVEANPVDQLASIRELIHDMQQGDVKSLIVIGGNPAYNVPAEMGFVKSYEQVDFRVHLAQEFNETSSVSQWHIPQAHYLESWSDARAYDGTISIQQPLIAPLYGGKTDHELISVLSGHPEHTSYQILRQMWQERFNGDDFESRWRKSVHDGLVQATQSEHKTPDWKFVDHVNLQERSKQTGSSHDNPDLEVSFCPDPTIWDGRFANNAWLQELPKPITKLTWDNAALVSPRTAERLGLTNYEQVDLSIEDRIVRAPVWITPCQPDNSISLSLGYGRTRSGRIGKNIGVNAYLLRPANNQWFVNGVHLKRTGIRYGFAATQNHHSMEGRDIVATRTFAQFERDPEFIEPERRQPQLSPSLYPKAEASENAWGMTIDQTACIGCNACVIACQSENNIPIVGKEQVQIGRVMHWLRIDRYYQGGIDSPDTLFQPMMCVHCENAPCELVCPVAATVHSHEGLNQMVYNRCVGTRYCSNNCPYKVRRFNFLNYIAEQNYDDEHSPSLSLLRNPNVTVRSRGVMEKCTYCIQRINEAKITSHKESRPIKDGEIQTACQQACPAKAIVFGNLNDRESNVSELKKSSLNYSVLAELNTVPRTSHLARLRNPHPDLEENIQAARMPLREDQ